MRSLQHLYGVMRMEWYSFLDRGVEVALSGGRSISSPWWKGTKLRSSPSPTTVWALNSHNRGRIIALSGHHIRRDKS